MFARSSLPKLGHPMGIIPTHARMPHIPLVDTMHNIDQHMAGARMKLPGLKARLGGSIRRPAPLSEQAHGAVKAALTHLTNKDASSAAAVLRASPEAMQHPVVQQAEQALRSSSGVAPAMQRLSTLARTSGNPQATSPL